MVSDCFFCNDSFVPALLLYRCPDDGLLLRGGWNTSESGEDIIPIHELVAHEVSVEQADFWFLCVHFSLLDLQMTPLCFWGWNTIDPRAAGASAIIGMTCFPNTSGDQNLTDIWLLCVQFWIAVEMKLLWNTESCAIMNPRFLTLENWNQILPLPDFNWYF